MNKNSFDIIIIGSGPIGLACGIESTKHNYSHLILEQGCLVNSLFNYPINMTFFSSSDRLEIGQVPFISHGEKPTRREALEYYRRVKNSWGLEVKTYERVLNVERGASEFEVTTIKDRYRASAVIVATGYYDHPNLLGIPGEDLPKVMHYYKEPHPFVDQNIAVVGAANSAVDVALETFRKGARVTMVIRESGLRPTIKYWVKPDIENRIKEGSITAYFNSQIQAIRLNAIDILTPEGKKILANDFVFAMTGYKPDYDFLQRIGIRILDDEMRTPYFNPDNYETNVAGLFLAGVVCGGMETNKWFIENSRAHALRIFQQIQKMRESG